MKILKGFLMFFIVIGCNNVKYEEIFEKNSNLRILDGIFTIILSL